jgi:hypothetical protein
MRTGNWIDYMDGRKMKEFQINFTVFINQDLILVSIPRIIWRLRNTMERLESISEAISGLIACTTKLRKNKSLKKLCCS